MTINNEQKQTIENLIRNNKNEELREYLSDIKNNGKNFDILEGQIFGEDNDKNILRYSIDTADIKTSKTVLDFCTDDMINKQDEYGF